MGLLDLFRRRVVVVRHLHSVPSDVLGKSVEALYREQPALKAVVDFLADNAASLPLKVYDRVSDTDRRRVTDDAAALLLSRPNATTTGRRLLGAMFHDYLLYGSCLWYVCPSVETPSGWEATHIPWAWVTDELTEDGLSHSAFKVQNPDSGRAEVTIPASSCVLFRAYDPMGPMVTASPVDALRQVLAEQISAWNFRNSVWKNGGRVTQYLTRPLGAPDWDRNGGRMRFAKSWKERYSGEDGVNTGGTPLLEDGMKLESVQFNAREAQWREATTLAREDVAAVYHVNPSLIWHTDGQTYASAKDNARALYADTLAPMLGMAESVINAFLLPMIGAPASEYAEFDLDAKLAASFEERASVMQSAVGGPWMTRNEARAKLNMPAIDGADELIVPLNVTEGGLAGPNDTDPTAVRYNARRGAGGPTGGDNPRFAGGAAHSRAMKGGPPDMSGPPSTGGVSAGWRTATVLKSRAEPAQEGVDEMAEALAHFLERQSRRVLRDLGGSGTASRPAVTKDGVSYPSWWDAARWNRELADDLEPIFRAICDRRGVEALGDLDAAPDLWNSGRTANFVRAMARTRARLFNETTYQMLSAALLEPEGGDSDRITAAERVFLNHAANRAARGARTFATAVAGFATKEAVRHAYPTDDDRVRRTKTWRHHGSKSPRDDHAAMDGETVGLDERFSNGADYPGDLALSAKDAVNCHCTMDVAVEKRESGGTYGAWTGKNDPDHSKRDEHADRYYAELRERDEDSEVHRVSQNTGIGEAVVRQAYRHVFTLKHNLEKGCDYFDADYDMSQSWQRISAGLGIQPHDLMLVYHEAIEDDFMYLSRFSYEDAHAATCAMGYDWAKACEAWKIANDLM